LIEGSSKTEKLIRRGERARQNFAEFCRFVLGFTPAAHQKQWIEELQKIGDDPSGRKLIIIAPPGSGKTQLVGVGFTAWMLGRRPERHYGLLSYADSVGWSRSYAIRNLIESSLPYRITFPEVKPDKRRWGTSEFQIARPDLADPHPTLRAGGTTSAVVAYRLNGLVIDDPHDQKNSGNKTNLDKVWENYDNAISTRLTSDAWEVVIGTRWSDADFIGRKLGQKGVKVLHTAALLRGDKSYWEEAYPAEFLINKRYQSPAMFAMQYMGDTKGGEAQIIRKLHTWDSYSRPPKYIMDELDLLVASSWDTAFKEKQQNDFTVGYIGGMDKHGRIYILDRVKGRWGLPGLLDQIAESAQKWNEFAIWVEDAASGTPAVQTLMAHSMLPVQAMPYKGGKMTRAHAIAPFLHGGHVLFPSGEEWFPDCEYQLTHYPNTGHDDDLDALFLLIDNLTKLRHPSTILNRPRIIMEMR